MTANQELYLEISLELSSEDAFTLVQALDEGKLPDLCGYFEVLYDEKSVHKLSGFSQLMLYFSHSDTTARIRIEILLAVLGIEKSNIQERALSKTDYLEAYKKHYHSFDITNRLTIVPSWEKDQTQLDEKNRIALYLDPGLAFGTGLHPTTKLCLQYLDENMQEGAVVIDAGCGSGILGIGALLLGAREVFGFDIDGNSIIAVKNNLELNPQLEDKFTIKQGGFDSEDFAQYSADFMIGNITAAVIKSNKDRIQNGHFPFMILSGILEEYTDEVISVFSDKWSLKDSRSLDGWSLLAMTRK